MGNFPSDLFLVIEFTCIALIVKLFHLYCILIFNNYTTTDNYYSLIISHYYKVLLNIGN